MASIVPHSCEDDIAVMCRTGVRDPRHVVSDRYKWPRKAILLVQSKNLSKIYHSTPKPLCPGYCHAERAFLDDLESAEQSSSLEDSFSKMRMTQPTTEYQLYINYSPCVDCAKQTITFINNHPCVEFQIHFAMTYRDGDGIKLLMGQDRITLSTMDSSKWKSMEESFLDCHINKLQNLKQQLQNKSGYEALQITVKDLGIESSPEWIQWREESDINEKERLEDLYVRHIDVYGNEDNYGYEDDYDNEDDYDSEDDYGNEDGYGYHNDNICYYDFGYCSDCRYEDE